MRIKTWLLALGMAAGLSASAFSQQYIQEDRYTPNEVIPEYLFGTPDFSTYGSGPQPNRGWYFNADYTRWTIEAPSSNTTIGAPVAVTSTVNESGLVNAIPATTASLTTSEMQNEFNDGSRFEIGFRTENDRGLIFGVSHINQNQDDMIGKGGTGGAGLNAFFSGPIVTFFDPAGVPFGIHFSEINYRNETEVDSFELMQTIRLEPARVPYAANWEFMFGVRYISFEEDFTGEAWFVDNVAGGLLTQDIRENFWRTDADNHIVGPQIAVRYYKQNGPVAVAIEGRGFAAYNYQSIRQTTEIDPLVIGAVAGIGSGLPNATTTDRTFDEFAPGGEVRIELSYTMTRKVRFRAGWTAWYLTNIARPSQMVVYNFPDFGINNNNTEDLFVHGAHMGVEFNH